MRRAVGPWICCVFVNLKQNILRFMHWELLDITRQLDPSPLIHINIGWFHHIPFKHQWLAIEWHNVIATWESDLPRCARISQSFQNLAYVVASTRWSWMWMMWGNPGQNVFRLAGNISFNIFHNLHTAPSFFVNINRFWHIPSFKCH